MKRLVIAILCFTFFLSPLLANAAISEAELEDFLSPIGWTAADLENYLEIFDMTIADFETVSDLQSFVGTPITAENRAELFERIGMKQEEVEALLSQYYDSIDQYYFLEDLEVAIEFYQDHGSELAEVEDLYAKIGISDEELEKLFLHLSQLDEQMLEQQMESIATRLTELGEFHNFEEMTETQKAEISSIWNDMLAVLKLDVNFYLTNQDTKQEASINDLIALSSLNGNRLLIEIYDNHNMLLLDMSLSEDMFDTEFFSLYDGTMGIVNELSHEHPYGEKMPKTASNFLLLTLIGFILTGISVLFLTRLQNKTGEQ